MDAHFLCPKCESQMAQPATVREVWHRCTRFGNLVRLVRLAF